MFCHRCRGRIIDKSVWCPTCGASQEAGGFAIWSGKPGVAPSVEPKAGGLKIFLPIFLAAMAATGVGLLIPVIESRVREWKAARNCSAPGPGIYIYIRKADFDSTAALEMALDFQRRGVGAMCGNLYGNSATLLGPYPSLRQASAAFLRFRLQPGSGDYIRLLKVGSDGGGTWADPSSAER